MEKDFYWTRAPWPIHLPKTPPMKSILFYRLIPLLFLAACLQGQPAGENQEYVILITYDGLRWQELFTGADPTLIADPEYVKDTTALTAEFWVDDPIKRRELLLPFFWNTLAPAGQLYGNRTFGNKVNCTNQHWFSYPGYNEILSGFADDERINSNDKIPNPNRTVLEFLNGQPGFEGKVAAFGSWDVFPFIIHEKRSGVPVNAGFEPATGNDLTEREQFLNELQAQIPSPWSTVRLDAFTHHYACEYLKKNRPKVLYIAYGETDDFAHDGHYDAYLKSARQTDAFIGEIWNWVQQDPQYKDHTTLIISTDHGRGTVPKESWQHHGKGKIDGSDEIWIAAIGPHTSALGEVKTEGQLYQNQLAATVSALFGIEYKSDKPAGKAISEIIE